MAIIIHQALYGDKNGGHALLKTTLSDEKLANKISNSTDLSDRGTDWNPAIRGFSYEDYYLIMKTYSDSKIRVGRVFSHVLILEKQHLNEVNDLTSLFGLFKKEIDKGISLNPIEYLPSSLNKISGNNRSLKVAEGLLNGSNIIWIGQDNFEELICLIWSNLWSSSRFDFHFGINFNPSAVSTTKQSLVCTPESLKAIWQKEKFTIVDKEDTIENPSPAVSYLVNHNTDSTFKNFLNQLGAQPVSIKELSVLEKGLETFNRVDEVKDFNELFNLYNIIKGYNTNATSNNLLLEKILNQIANILPNVNSTSINALRKLVFHSSFTKLKSTFESTLDTWLDANLFDEVSNSEMDNSRIAINSLDKDSQQWWINSVKKALQSNFQNWKKTNAKVLKNWIIKDSKNCLAILQNYLAITPNLELELHEVFNDKNETETVNTLKQFCIKNKWCLFHANMLVQLQSTNIIKEQLKIDTDSTNKEGLLYISQKITGKQFISESIQNSDSRLMEISASLLSNNKSLISEINLKNSESQKILVGVLKNNNQFATYYKNPETELIFPLLELVNNNEDVEDNLLELISNSKFNNISNFTSRKTVWDKLNGETKDNFLNATILSLSQEPDFLEKEYEKPIKDFIKTDKFIKEYFSKNESDIGKIVNFISKYSSISEDHLSSLLQNVNYTFNGIEAQKLGKLVYSKSWFKCLTIIQNKAGSNQSFKTTFQECYLLLDFFSQGWAVIQGLVAKTEISKDDWWQSLESLACKIFPEGPTDSKVWKNAGGSESDLKHKSTGKEMWSNAIHKLRNGGTKEITVNSLLKEMKKQFPNNSDLNILIELDKKI